MLWCPVSILSMMPLGVQACQIRVGSSLVQVDTQTHKGGPGRARAETGEVREGQGILPRNLCTLLLDSLLQSPYVFSCAFLSVFSSHISHPMVTQLLYLLPRPRWAHSPKCTVGQACTIMKGVQYPRCSSQKLMEERTWLTNLPYIWAVLN